MKRLLAISESLNHLFEAVNSTTNLTFEDGILQKIIDDSKNDQVSEKNYILSQSKGQVLVEGIVQHYEPETIWIDFKNFNSKTKEQLTDIIDGYEFAFGSGSLFRTEEESIKIFENGLRIANIKKN